MNNLTMDTDVLIIGAGPTGLFLANECARRGLRYRIVEKRATQSTHSKALAIFPRTLEIFDMAGIVEPFLDAANRVTSAAIITHGRRIAHMPFTPAASPYPFIAMIPQDVTEKFLAEALKKKSGDVAYRTALVSAVQHDDHVSATLEQNEQKHEVNASFLVGCDGAHSQVRHSLNLPFEGARYPASFLLADVETNEAFQPDEFQLCPSASGPLALFPMSSTRRRIVATIDATEGDAPSLELVRNVLRERGPGEVEALSMHWSSYFHIHHRHTPRLQSGRIFIAGDAAHVHSPFGAQGMNTGLHDAWNLVWKLDLALHGRGNDQLLESYTAERLPVIKSVIQITDFLTRAMGTPSKLAEAFRDTVIPLVSRLTPVQHAFVQKLSELGVAYQGSPIVEGPGERYFDDSLRGGDGIRSKFVLLMPADADPSTKHAAQQIDALFADWVDVRTAQRQGLTLLRPDGYIAYFAPKGADGKTVAAIEALLERQTANAA
jgi:3-(3-hydroxy-phenyl)propionate hydroxylase